MEVAKVTEQTKITVVINQQHDGNILLSRLVADNAVNNLVIQIQVKAGIDATIIDDLENIGVQSASIEFCLHKSAQLMLRMHSVYGMKKVSTLGDSQHVVPAYKTDFTTMHDASFYAETIDVEKDCDHYVSRKLVVRLLGEQSSADVKYSCFGTKKKKFTFEILQEHKVKNATSNVDVRSVLEDESSLTCKCMIHVCQLAQKTHAELENKNILLGIDAHVISIPMLEIEADDVVCKHGAAVSKLDADCFFYLQSRGIDLYSARIMLIESFLK